VATPPEKGNKRGEEGDGIGEIMRRKRGMNEGKWIADL
jgi:hypothetical protein